MINKKLLFINFYIDSNRSPHGGCKNLLWPIYLAKRNEVYIYQGIKNTTNIKDGKVCKILLNGGNSIIDGDPDNKYQKPGKHSMWKYPEIKGEFTNIILNADIIIILGAPAHPHYFQPELSNTNAFIIQQPVYNEILSITNYVLENEMINKCISEKMFNIIKKYRTYNKKNNYNIGIVGNITQRKGQLNFFINLDSNKVKKYIFHLIGPIYDINYFKKIIYVCNYKKIKYKFHKKLEGEDYFRSLCSLKCIVHYSIKDANPRVIWDSIYSGVPFFASTKCQIPEIINKYGVINDNLNGFYNLLKQDYGDSIINFVDKELNTETYINNLFDKIIQDH